MICTKCLYPDTKPDLFFDDEGVCSACRAHEAQHDIDWNARLHRLEGILEDNRNGSGYDCIVPSSGGKDSTFQVLTLKAMGANPLAVTATTCHLTDLGRRNIDNLARFATTIEVSPNKVIRAKLNKLGLLTVGDISWPEHAAIFTTPFHVAKQHGIPLIMYGESPQNAYGGPPGTEEAEEMTQRWVTEFGGFNGLRASDMVGQLGIKEEHMVDYLPPDDVKGIRAYFLGQFLRWDSRANAGIAAKAGMKTKYASQYNPWPFENLDNAQTGIHDYFCGLKYGYARAEAQLSVDIRNGILTKKEAEFWIDEPAEDRVPHAYLGVLLEDVLKKIDVSMEEFQITAERYRHA